MLTRGIPAGLVFILAVFLIGAAAAQPPAPPPAPPAPAPQRADMDAGNAAFQQQDYATAVEAYRRALAAGINESLLHFRLGYALHVTGHHEEALTHHRQAAHINHPALRIDALYNAACACALLGRTDDALGWLERAVDAGFQDLNQIGTDTDLDSLRADPRFKSLVDGIGKSPRLHQWMDFFLGEWSCRRMPEGDEVLTLTISRPLEGSHALASASIQSRRQNAPPNQPPPARWSGLLYPDSASRTWLWTQSDGMGTRMEFKGERVGGEGEAMRFTGRQFSPAGPSIHLRLTYTPQPDGRVIEKAETSEDGTAWRTHHEAEYVKRPPG